MDAADAEGFGTVTSTSAALIILVAGFADVSVVLIVLGSGRFLGTAGFGTTEMSTSDALTRLEAGFAATGAPTLADLIIPGAGFAALSPNRALKELTIDLLAGLADDFKDFGTIGDSSLLLPFIPPYISSSSSSSESSSSSSSSSSISSSISASSSASSSTSSSLFSLLPPFTTINSSFRLLISSSCCCICSASNLSLSGLSEYSKENGSSSIANSSLSVTSASCTSSGKGRGMDSGKAKLQRARLRKR